MRELNLPEANLTIREHSRIEVFDIFRNKYVACTPEEWVRQHLLHFLVNHRHYPQSLIAVEKSLDINGLQRRFDAVVHNRNLQPLMIVECKAPEVILSQQVFDQIMAYNYDMQLKYILISNGIQHICMHKQTNRFVYLNDIPVYDELINQ